MADQNQSLEIHSPPTGGSFTVMWRGLTTEPIPHDVTREQFDAIQMRTFRRIVYVLAALQ